MGRCTVSWYTIDDVSNLAFGSNDTYGLTLHTPPEIGLRLWRHPSTPGDISTLFTRYVRGELPAIPWSEDPLAAETVTIQKHLIGLNQSGRWTVGSQPTVNGVESADEVFGWGPKGGYIFQKVPHSTPRLTKAFVEFFTSEQEWEKIKNKIKEDRHVSFYAGNSNVYPAFETEAGRFHDEYG
jgi:methylenetetrahydrofolate reductase (NADPH)